MADRARSRGRNFGSRSKRQVTWIGPSDQSFVQVNSGTKVLHSIFDPFISDMTKPTIVRTRGEVTVVPSVFTGSLDVVGAYGMAVVTDQAVAAGVASIPGPFSEANWDGWLVWRSFGFRLEFDDATGILQAGWRHEVDSKAMRKVSDNETVCMLVESQTGAFRISMQLRQLYKLS